jgi:peptidyl-prolyl cis-trans isomerase C
MKSAYSSAAAAAVAAVVLAFSTPMPIQAAAGAAPADSPPAPSAKHGAASSDKTSDSVVAVVNGTPISRAVFEYYVKNTTGKSVADLPPEVASQVLDNLVRGELLMQQAQKDGLDKTTDVSSQLVLMRMQVLGEAEANSYLKDKPASDAQLHAEYDAQIAMMPKTQYHARHILVSSQSDAQQIIDQLKGGASFEDLAKSKSTDSTKDQGGDLGWFSPTSMVKPFADAVTALKKGETTQTPVQTPFGWHVIQLLDTRDETPPPFDSVKQRVQQLVQQRKVREYQDQLMKTATVKKNL